MPALSHFLETCPPEIRANMRQLQFLPGEAILSPGFCGEQIFLLVSGQAKLVAHAENGTSVVLSLYNDWELLGELEAFTESVCEKSIVALLPCEVYALEKASFFAWLQLDFEFNRYILNRLSQKLLRLSATSQVSMSGFLREQVAHILLTNLKDGRYFPYGKQVLAESIGTSIRSLNRVLEKMIEQDLISVSGSRIQVKNAEALSAMAKARGH